MRRKKIKYEDITRNIKKNHTCLCLQMCAASVYFPKLYARQTSFLKMSTIASVSVILFFFFSSSFIPLEKRDGWFTTSIYRW